MTVKTFLKFFYSIGSELPKNKITLADQSTLSKTFSHRCHPAQDPWYQWLAIHPLKTEFEATTLLFAHRQYRLFHGSDVTLVRSYYGTYWVKHFNEITVINELFSSYLDESHLSGSLSQQH